MSWCEDALTERIKNEPKPMNILESAHVIPSELSHATYRVPALDRPYGVMSEERQRTRIEDSHIVSSEVLDSSMGHLPNCSTCPPTGKHSVMLDIDIPAKLIPSSTEGHSHLYIDKEMSWREYRKLLRALMKAGIIEKGYYEVSVKRKATHLRLPWVKKVESKGLSY